MNHPLFIGEIHPWMSRAHRGHESAGLFAFAETSGGDGFASGFEGHAFAALVFESVGFFAFCAADISHLRAFENTAFFVTGMPSLDPSCTRFCLLVADVAGFFAFGHALGSFGGFGLCDARGRNGQCEKRTEQKKY